MEKIKAYHSIKNFLTEEQRIEVAKMLGLNEIDITKRVWGKDNELEFILSIYLLGNCKSIYAFEEGISKLTNSESADLFIELKTGKRILVEIKSTEKILYKITEKNLKLKQDFAKFMNAELYFAIKINNYWLLYEDKYIEAKNRKIELVKEYKNSKFNDVFGDKTFLFPKGLKIKSIYTNNTTNHHLGIYNEDYGSLVKYTIQYNKNKIISINSTKHEKYFLIVLYERFQDIASNMKQQIIKIDRDRTMIIEELTEDISAATLSSFMLAPIKHMLNVDGEKYDLSKYIVELIDDKQKIFYDPNSILWSFLFLAENGYPVMEIIDGKMYDFKKIIRKYYPEKNSR